MAEAKSIRPDIDIEEEIHDLMMTYPPLAHDRHRLHIDVQNGGVIVKGYLKALPTLEYLLNRIEQVEGVKSIESSQLYNDETIRLQVGRVIPPGVFANLEYGAVILSGKLPEGITTEALVRNVGHVAGVHRVITSFTA